MNGITYRVFPTVGELAEAAADGFLSAATTAVAARGRFLVALSGGRTPHHAFHLLRSTRYQTVVPWSKTHVFWSDERAVPQSDPASNAGEARRALLDQMPGVTLHPLYDGEADLAAAAEAAAADLRATAGDEPVFDLIWLGMGADGHTASLFPGAGTLEITDRLVAVCDAPPEIPAGGGQRLTLTLPVLNAAREVTFLVSGADKAAAFARVRAGDRALPCAQIRGPRITWLVDAAAAGA